MPNDEVTAKATAKAELFGIGAGIEVSRKWTVTAAEDRSFWGTVKRALAGAPVPIVTDEPGREKDLIDSLKTRAKYFPKPNVIEAYQVDTYWARLEQQPQVTAIASGKGGVGKSTIALGLAEAFSQNENVLLIDFDLHNRGLTSKYRGLRGDAASSVLSELTRFRETVLKPDALPREAGSLVLSRISPELFHNLRKDFCHTPGSYVRSPISLLPLYQQSVRDRNDWDKGVRPRNVFFLPSRLPNTPFLGSPESRLDAAEIALFLTFLAHHVRGSPQAITRVIVDCHGAHDMFMVGAILASQHLVIVSKPEESAFEGTIELVRFAQSAIEATNVFPRSHTLVFNEVRPQDRTVAETLFQLYYDNPKNIKFEDVPTIPESNSIQDELKYYQQPSMLAHEEIGDAIQRITAGADAAMSLAYLPPPPKFTTPLAPDGTASSAPERTARPSDTVEHLPLGYQAAPKAAEASGKGM